MRFMVKFDVLAGAPSKADVEECGALAHRIVSINSWFKIPVVIAAIYTLVLLSLRCITFILHPESVQDATALITRLLAGFVTLGMGIIIFIVWKDHWLEVETSCLPIDHPLTDEAIKLAESYEEIEAYRKSIVATRAVTNGDYEAMRCFATARDETNRKAAQECAARESLDRLNRLS